MSNTIHFGNERNGMELTWHPDTCRFTGACWSDDGNAAQIDHSDVRIMQYFGYKPRDLRRAAGQIEAGGKLSQATKEFAALGLDATALRRIAGALMEGEDRQV